MTKIFFMPADVILPVSPQKDKPLVDNNVERLKGWLDQRGKNLRDWSPAAVLPAG
jgi:hypothetical protein